MADPYSGAAVAAGAISKAVGDMFEGLLQGQTGAEKIRQQEQTMGQQQRAESTKQAQFGPEMEHLQAQTSGLQQHQAIQAAEAPERLAQLRAHRTIAQAQADVEGSRLKQEMDLTQHKVRMAKVGADLAEETAPEVAQHTKTILNEAEISYLLKKGQYDQYVKNTADLSKAIAGLAQIDPNTPEGYKSAIKLFMQYGHAMPANTAAFQTVMELMKMKAQAAGRDYTLANHLATLEVNIQKQAKADAALQYEKAFGKALPGVGDTEGETYLNWLEQVAANRLRKAAQAHFGIDAEVETPPIPPYLQKRLEAQTKPGWFSSAPHSQAWLKAYTEELYKSGGDKLKAEAAGAQAEATEKIGSPPGATFGTKGGPIAPTPATVPTVPQIPRAGLGSDLALKTMRDAAVTRLFPGRTWQQLTPQEKQSVAGILPEQE